MMEEEDFFKNQLEEQEGEEDSIVGGTKFGTENSIYKELREQILDDDWRFIVERIKVSSMMLNMIVKSRKEIMEDLPLIHILLQYCPNEDAPDVDGDRMHLLDLVIHQIIPHMDPKELEAKDSNGDTALHIAAAKGFVDVAKALLEKNLNLVNILNTDGEIPLLKAALYGRREMFRQLISRGSKIRNRRFDGATALHCAILGNNFELANEIIEGDPRRDFFILARDQLGLTVLHHLVSMPDAFGCHLNLLDSLLYKCVSVEQKPTQHSMESDDEEAPVGTFQHSMESDDEEAPMNKGQPLPSNSQGDEENLYHLSYARHLPKLSHGHSEIERRLLGSNIQGDKRRNEFNRIFFDPLVKWIQTEVYERMKLTKYGKKLIAKKKKHTDAMGFFCSIAGIRNYWQCLALGNIPPAQSSGLLFDRHRNNDKVVDRWMETPLILATRLGHDKLVLKILEIRPTAAAYRGKEGKNLLHVAVETRQESIFEKLLGIGEVDPRLPLRLKSSKDLNGNTILHLAAMANNQPSSPMQMLEEFKWFERVKKILPGDLVNHRNKDGKTAREVFTESHENMMVDAKKQLTDTARACCGALVTAVTFAAGFSIINDKDKSEKNCCSSSSDDDHQSKVVLKVFSHIYTLGLSCTGMALVQFMALLMASYKEEDFKISLPTQYVLAFASLFTAMFAMLVAFVLNTYVSLHKDLNSNWRNYLGISADVLIFPLICLLVLRYQAIRFPFFSIIRTFLMR